MKTTCGLAGRVWAGLGNNSKRFVGAKSYDIEDFTKLQILEIRQYSLQKLCFFSVSVSGVRHFHE